MVGLVCRIDSTHRRAGGVLYAARTGGGVEEWKTSGFYEREGRNLLEIMMG
jgi:hypothetical protein